MAVNMNNMIEVEIIPHFSVVRETLERIGIANRQNKVLNPSCYLLHKKGRYYIMHFKKLLELDGNETNFSEEDEGRQSAIARLLESWGLVKILNPNILVEYDRSIFVLPFCEKKDWEIIHKYSIGSKKRKYASNAA